MPRLPRHHLLRPSDVHGHRTDSSLLSSQLLMRSQWTCCPSIGSHLRSPLIARLRRKRPSSRLYSLILSDLALSESPPSRELWLYQKLKLSHCSLEDSSFTKGSWKRTWASSV